MNAIDTSDISEWFKYNSTYSFLNRINATIAAVSIIYFIQHYSLLSQLIYPPILGQYIYMTKLYLSEN